MENKITLALDIEGTLISHASTMIPRPGLRAFLEFCGGKFNRIVFLSFVDEERGRVILNHMADEGHMPEWVRTAELKKTGTLSGFYAKVCCHFLP